MSKAGKILLIVAVACLVVGAGLAAIGFGAGAVKHFSVGIENGKVSQDFEIVSGTIDIQNFDKLVLDMASVDFSVEEGDGYRLEYKVPEEYVPEVTEKNGTLTIKQPKYDRHMNFIGFQTEDNYYRLIVPDKNKVVTADIYMTSGDFTDTVLGIEGDFELTSGNVHIAGVPFSGKVKLTSGDFRLENVTGKKLDVVKTSGELWVKDSELESVYIDTTSGEAYIDSCKVKDIEFASTSGDIEIVLKGQPADYNYDLHATSGDIEVNGKEYERNYVDDNGASGNIKGSCTSGEIEVRFE